jgi:methyl-accepting chemotaxis protein
MSTQNRLRYADSVEGVDIEKRYDESEFPFPSVVYDFTSNRDETVELTVEDVLPDAVAAENVGFHADYNGNDWAVDGDRLIFDRELQPGAECRTIYAVSATETEKPSEIFVEPSAIDVSPPVADESGADVSVELDVPAAPVADGRGADPDTDGGSATATESDDDLLGALASEVESDEIERSDLEVVASAVAEVMDGSSGSVDARLTRIESDIAELRAYSDALAEFLDEHDGADAVIERFEQRVSAVESDLDTVRSRTDDLRSDVDSVRDDTGDLDAEVDALAASLDEVSTQIDELQSSLGHTAEEQSVNERVATLEDRLTEFEDFVENVRAAFE